MITFKTNRDKDCFIDPDEVVAVIPCAWGSVIRLRGGGEGIVVYGEPGEVMAAIEVKGLKQVGWYQSDTDTFCHLDYNNREHYPVPLYIKEGR